MKTVTTMVARTFHAPAPARIATMASGTIIVILVTLLLGVVRVMGGGSLAALIRQSV